MMSKKTLGFLTFCLVFPVAFIAAASYLADWSTLSHGLIALSVALVATGYVMDRRTGNVAIAFVTGYVVSSYLFGAVDAWNDADALARDVRIFAPILAGGGLAWTQVA